MGLDHNPTFHGDQKVRNGEQFREWYRSDRIFKKDDRWYVHTREGIEVGPYDCAFDAEIEAATLIQKLQSSEPDEARRIIASHTALAGSTLDLTHPSYVDYVEEIDLDEYRSAASL